MAYRKLFIQTGQTPPRGFIVNAELSRPSVSNTVKNGATVYVYGNPYRRVYRDKSGHLYVNMNGQKAPCFIAQDKHC